jgi:plasmid segregation protein ParM
LKKQWPHTVLLENPRMAVADGFCRYALGLLRRRAATSVTAAANG